MARILVIDDEPRTLTMLRRILEAEQHAVDVAGDGNEALKLCRAQAFDLVITDILMPNKEGLETIAEMHREYPAIKIIAMSGGGRIGVLDFLPIAEKMGADLTLQKPFLRNELLTAVNSLLGLEAGSTTD